MEDQPQNIHDSFFENEIDVRRYLALLWSRILFILLITFAATIITFVVSQTITPTYQSNTTLLVELTSTPGSQSLNSVRANESLARLYSQLLIARSLLSDVVDEMDLNMRPRELADMIGVRAVPETPLIRVSITDTDPERAAEINNILIATFIEQNEARQTAEFQLSAENLTEQLSSLEELIEFNNNAIALLQDDDSEEARTELARLQSEVAQYNQSYTTVLQSIENIRLAQTTSVSRITQIDPATSPTQPISPDVSLNTIIAFAMGLTLSVAIVLGQDFFDDTIKNPDAISKSLNLPVLAQIGYFDATQSPTIVLTSPRTPVAESFRSLRLNLKYATVDNAPQSLLITSSVPEEGKSTIALNLGIALAQGQQDVILMEGDLRRPQVHNRLGLRKSQGVSGLIIGSASFKDVLQTTKVPNLTAIASGPTPPDPSQLFDTARATDIIEALEQQSDMVIVDAPPLMAVSDALPLSQRVDGVVMVVRFGHTKTKSVKRVVEQLRRANANIIGLVVTDIGNLASRYGQEYFDYTEYTKYQTSETTPSANGSTASSSLKNRLLRSVRG